MQNFALIGYPISHSKSPALFAAAYNVYNKACNAPHLFYTLIEDASLSSALNSFLYGNYKGINVTAPFKELLFTEKYLNILNKDYTFTPDKISSLLKSANILVKEQQYGNSTGKPVLRSYNSDFMGVRSIIGSLGEKKEINHITVVGAGGAGKAAILAAADFAEMANDKPKQDCLVTVVNRTDKSGFCNMIWEQYPMCKIEFCPLENEDMVTSAIGSSDLTIYTLPLRNNIVEKALQKKPQFLLEANYANPSFSNLKNGIEYIPGQEWLLQQAIPAYILFTGIEPCIEAMKKIII